MSPFRRYRWFFAAGAITAVFALTVLILPRGPVLTAITDFADFLLTLLAALAMLFNAIAARRATRRFWFLMAAGCLLWAVNLGGWAYCEGIRHIELPDPWFMDVFLFVHLIPMIAAVALRPHRSESDQSFRAGTFDFLLLLVWWLFLYAFVVFPSQYITVDVSRYDRAYGALYMVESAVVVLMLAIVAQGATAGWRKLYLYLMAGSASYAVASQYVNWAVSTGKYFSGSFYDVPLIGAIGWIAATALSAREWEMEVAQPSTDDKWGTIALRLAMLAILSLPALGLWTFLGDGSPALARTFRLFTVLAAMLVVGAFVFMRQYLQDRALIRLLEDSRRSFENEQRLQNHLVQREKLASLGQLVAGAAREIDHPLTDIMQDAEKLWSHHRLREEQGALVRKIVHQAQRTRDLIGSLLSFAQQRSGGKTMVDLRMLLQRSLQMRELQLHEHKIRIEASLEPNLPKTWGDGHQLFQAFVQIMENALDALEEKGGGTIRVGAQMHREEIVVQFRDSGPGIKEPHRVFDPFYTTKPIGKGTGLGLSVVYGVVQDHGGQITCHNNAEGGASFILRIPVQKGDSQALAAAQV
jgi:signal transduction histidine kinase